MPVLPEGFYENIFNASPWPSAVLDLAFTLVEVNNTYVVASGHARAELIGRHVFDVFHPDPSEVDGIDALRASLARVAATGVVDRVPMHHYFPPDANARRGLSVSYASTVNVPIVDENGEVIAIVVESQGLTPAHDEDMRATETQPAKTHIGTDTGDRRFADHAATSISSAAVQAELLAEIGHLKTALTSRSTIDRAVGMVMNEYHCAAGEAFVLLSKLSQDSNVKLRVVAQQLVATTVERGSPS